MRSQICILIAFLMISFACAVPSFAQEGDAGDRLLERELRQRQLEELARERAGQEISAPEVPGVVAEAVCFPIQSVEIEGNTVLPTADLAKITSAFENQCLGQVSIGNLLQQLSAYYAELGFITTRAYVPPQDIGAQVLKVTVFEGKIEEFVHLQSDKGGQIQEAKSRKLLSAMPQRAGDVFQLRDLEHGLEQINRLRSSQATANLQAGQAPGTSKIVVTEQKVDPVRGTIGLDNRGDPETGEYQLNLGLEVDDLLQLNDALFLSYSGAENSNGLAFGISVPFRRWLFSANGSYSETLQPITATSELFSQTSNLNVQAERLLFRDARTKFFAFGGARSYRNQRYINIVPLAPQHLISLRFGLRGEHRTPKSVFSGSVAWVLGAPFLGGDRDPAAPLPGAPRSEFNKLEVRATYVRPFENGTQLTVSFSGQMANKPLYSQQQISIGGWQSVRGYSGYSFSGDSGAFMRAEYGLPVGQMDWRRAGRALSENDLWNPFEKAVGGARAFAFLDGGSVRQRASGKGAEFMGLGAGFSIQMGLATVRGEIALPLISANGQNSGAVQAYLGVDLKVF